MHVEFGVGNPALCDLMYGRPLIRSMSPAASAARSELLKFMRQVEDAGRLRLPIRIAINVVESVAVGVTLHLIRTNSIVSDPLVSITRDAVMATLIGPDYIQAMYDKVPIEEKKLYWIKGTSRRLDGYIFFAKDLAKCSIGSTLTSIDSRAKITQLCKTSTGRNPGGFHSCTRFTSGAEIYLFYYSYPNLSR